MSEALTEQKYYSILTAVGLAKTASGWTGGNVKITQLAAGDGGGAYCKPTADMTALFNEVWRGDVISVKSIKESPNIIQVTAKVPRDVGGFIVREMAVYDVDGDMIGICNSPDILKALIIEGAYGELTLRMQFAVLNTEKFEFFFSPADIEEHNEDPDAHKEALKSYVTQAQMAEHTTAEEGERAEIEARTDEKIAEVLQKLEDALNEFKGDQSVIQTLQPTEKVATIRHDWGRYPHCELYRTRYALGVGGLAEGPLGGDNLVSINAAFEQVENHSVSVMVPKIYAQDGEMEVQQLAKGMYSLIYPTGVESLILIMR